MARIRNEEVGFIFQSFHLIADLNVVDNVEIPLLYRRGLSGKERRQMALKALDRVGLSSRVKHFPSQLSGGQQQRVAVARAIVAQPHILLARRADRQFGTARWATKSWASCTSSTKRGTTIVMVTHDQRLADRTGRTVRLFDGRQVQ